MTKTESPRAGLAWRASALAAALLLGAGVWRLGGGGTQPAAAERLELAASCCVASLDLNKALEKLDERTEREKELQAFVTTLEAELKKLSDQGKQAEEDLKILPQGSPEWRNKRDEAVRLAARLQAEREASQAIALDRQKRLQVDLFAKIKDAAARFAEREGFMIVIADDSAQTIPDNANDQQVQAAILGRRLIFASPATDISEGVARMMNTEFKGR